MIPSRSVEELKQIALDLHGGRIFTDRHLDYLNPNENDMLRHVFLIFMLMDNDQLKEFIAEKPALLFEYMSKAGPRTVNGLPQFFSVQALNDVDTKLVFELVTKLEAAQQSALESLDSNGE